MDRGEWVERVIDKGGAECGYCGTWRTLGDEYTDDEADSSPRRKLEECPKCGDGPQDLWAVSEDY